jgi:uracil-DNA glycosylase family 4
MRSLINRLAAARIGQTTNFYREGEGAALRRARLASYLESRAEAPLLLVGEAPGYRGARISGIPFTSERQLTGSGPAESTATIVHRVLAELGLTDEVLLWNVVPTHPGTAISNRAPTAAEVAAGLPFALALAEGRRVVAVGRIAATALGAEYVRHPSHGGLAEFRKGLLRFRPGGRPCPPFFPNFSCDEDLQRQARRNHARLVSRGC